MASKARQVSGAHLYRITCTLHHRALTTVVFPRASLSSVKGDYLKWSLILGFFVSASCSSTSSNSGSLGMPQAAREGPWLLRLWSGGSSQLGLRGAGALESCSWVPGLVPLGQQGVAPPSTFRLGQPLIVLMCGAETVLARDPRDPQVIKTFPSQGQVGELGTAGNSELWGADRQRSTEGCLQGRLHIKESRGAEGEGRLWSSLLAHCPWSRLEERRGMNTIMPCCPSVSAAGTGLWVSAQTPSQPRIPEPWEDIHFPNAKTWAQEGAERAQEHTSRGAPSPPSSWHNSRALQMGLQAQKHPTPVHWLKVQIML